jgi:hypothetical protein
MHVGRSEGVEKTIIQALWCISMHDRKMAQRVQQPVALHGFTNRSRGTNKRFAQTRNVHTMFPFLIANRIRKISLSRFSIVATFYAIICMKSARTKAPRTKAPRNPRGISTIATRVALSRKMIEGQ